MSAIESNFTLQKPKRKKKDKFLSKTNFKFINRKILTSKRSVRSSV